MNPALDLTAQEIAGLPRLPGLPLQAPFFDQADWGSNKLYADFTRWSSYAPRIWNPHYGGGGPYGVRTRAILFKILRAWQKYHQAKPWFDIAYDAAAWYPFVRLRGLNHNGGARDSAFWGGITFQVVFAIGPGEEPHRKMLKGFALAYAEAPGPVIDHGRLPRSPNGVDQNTSCAGPMRTYIDDEFWLDYLGKRTLKLGMVSPKVRSLKRRLGWLGYFDGGESKTYTRKLARAVEAFQADQGIKVTGNVRHRDWKRLCDWTLNLELGN